MKNLSKQRIVLSAFLAVLIVATLAFIFTRSAKSESESASESANVSQQVKPVVDPKDEIPQEVFTHYLRKAAHFSEFALLALEMICLLVTLTGKTGIKDTLIVLLITMFIAVCDETIQIFSKRGSLVSDIWIDFTGAAISVLLFVLAFNFIYLPLRSSIRKKSEKSGNNT